MLLSSMLARVRKSFLMGILSLASYVIITESSFYDVRLPALFLAALSTFIAMRSLESLLKEERYTKKGGSTGRFVVFIDSTIIAIVLSLFFFPFALLLIILNLGITYLYPHVKDDFPLTGIVKGYYAMSAVLFAAAAARSFTLLSLALAFLTFLSIFAFETTRDICNIRGEKYRKTSFATLYGDKVAGILAAYVLLGVIFFSLLPSLYYGELYLFIAGIADTILAYPAFRLLFEPTKHAQESAMFIILGLVVLVLAFVVGALG